MCFTRRLRLSGDGVQAPATAEREGSNQKGQGYFCSVMIKEFQSLKPALNLNQPGLEYWFRQKRTLVDFRRGPLGTYFDGFASHLQAKGYCQNWGGQILSRCCQFNAFLIDQDVTKCKELSESLVNSMHLLQSNVDLNMIRSWLGHASIETTHGYVEIDLEMRRKTLQCCERLLPNKTSRGPSWQRNNDILSWLSKL
jgi:hypothetical protein